MKIWSFHIILILGLFGCCLNGLSSNGNETRKSNFKSPALSGHISGSQSAYTSDLSVTSVSRIEYTQIPLDQASDLASAVVFSNVGSEALTNVSLSISIYYEDGSVYKKYSSNSLSTLASGASASFSVNDISIGETGKFILKSFPELDQTDENQLNDTSVYEISITDSIYARDDGVSSDVIGIGAENGGYIGQQFTIKKETNLISISGYLFGDEHYEKKKLAFAVWDEFNGKPNNILGTTDTVTYGSLFPGDYTIRMSGGALKLTAGTYVVTAIELDTTLTLGLSSDVVTHGTSWINWPTNSSGWTHLESFGAPHAKTPMIRMNLISCTEPEISVNITDASCSSCSDGALDISTKNLVTYYYLWSNGLRTAENNNLYPGIYALVVRDKLGCSYGYNYTVSYTTGIQNISQNEFQIFPNPSAGHFFIKTGSYDSEKLNLKVFESTGKLCYQTVIEKGSTLCEINLPQLPKGAYLLLLSGNNGHFSQQLVIQ